MDSTRRGDVGERIGVEYDQVRGLSCFQGAVPCFTTEESSSIDRCSLECLQGRESCLHQQPQFIVQSDTRVVE